MSRVLLSLRKGEPLKYISHRDYVRAFEFALRRARIPVAYSEGFNPRPKMSFGLATGVGVTSDDERIQVELSAPLPASEVMERLNACMPAGMEVLSAEEAPEGVKSPISGLNASEFEIEVSGVSEESLAAAVTNLMNTPEIRILRKSDRGSKEVDIRPHLLAAVVTDTRIRVSLASGSSGGAGPKDFINALSSLLPEMRVERAHRLRQFRSDA